MHISPPGACEQVASDLGVKQWFLLGNLDYSTTNLIWLISTWCSMPEKVPFLSGGHMLIPVADM